MQPIMFIIKQNKTDNNRPRIIRTIFKNRNIYIHYANNGFIQFCQQKGICESGL